MFLFPIWTTFSSHYIKKFPGDELQARSEATDRRIRIQGGWPTQLGSSSLQRRRRYTNRIDLSGKTKVQRNPNYITGKTNLSQEINVLCLEKTQMYSNLVFLVFFIVKKVYQVFAILVRCLVKQMFKNNNILL